MKRVNSLVDKMKYLEEVHTAYQEMRQVFAMNPNATWIQAQQVTLTRQNAGRQRKAEEYNYKKRMQLEAEQAERDAADEKQILANNPHLIKQLEESKAAEEKDKQESYDIINRFFDLSEEDFKRYLVHSNDISESPVQRIIQLVEAGQGSRKTTYYSCTTCFGSSYLSLNSCESHIYTEDHDRDREPCQPAGKIPTGYKPTHIRSKRTRTYRHVKASASRTEAGKGSTAFRTGLTITKPTMSLSHSTYLQTLPSERRRVATFQSGTLQQQLDSIRSWYLRWLRSFWTYTRKNMV